MGAFDLNNLYFVKNAAPKTSSFEELAKPIGEGFNLGTKYNESYNKNSLQNLIAQRENEGVPYYMLGNEAAKWDLNAAQSMDKDYIGRIDHDYNMDKDQFDTWRKTMARRICGLILQKADQLQIPEEERFRVLNIAASFVITYDPDLAAQLRQEATRRSYNQARTAPKEKAASYKNLWGKAQEARDKAETYDKTANANKYWGLRNYATAAEAVAEREAKTNVVAEYNDVLRLLSNFRNRDKEIDPKSMLDYALSDKFRLINEGGASTPSGDVSNIVTPENVDTDGTGLINGKPATAKNIAKKIPSKAASGNPAGVGSVDYSIVSMLSGVGEYPYIDNEKFNRQFEKVDSIEDINEAVKYLTSLKSQLSTDSKIANKGAGKTEGADKNFFDTINKKLEKLEELQKGGISHESAKILKLNGKSATEAAAARAEWGRISNLPKLYYTNPGAILPAMQRSLLPEERTTDQDVMRTVLSGAGIDDDIASTIINAYASANDDTFANMMKKEAYKSAARALAPFILEKLQKRYNTIVKSAGSEEAADKALQETYEMSDEVLEYLKGNKVLYTDKVKYEARAKEIMDEVKAKEDAQWAKEHSGVDNSMMDLDLGGI